MVNKVILIGNVGMNPEIRTLPSGSSVANFSLATTEYKKDKNGERKNETEWHRLVVYPENLVKLVEKYVTKGSKLYIEGCIRTRKYTDQSNVERVSVEIVLRDYNSTIKLLDSKNQQEGERPVYSEKSKESTDSSSHDDENGDDEIPF